VHDCCCSRETCRCGTGCTSLQQLRAGCTVNSPAKQTSGAPLPLRCRSPRWAGRGC
jgi:hypothetical protein